MDILIDAVRDPGDLDHERIVLRADTDLDIGLYILLAARAGAEGKTLGGRVPFCFWFPDRDVQRGDLLIVYTKSGSSKRKDNPSGKASHFFYWGLEHPIWNNDELRPVLIEAKRWKKPPARLLFFKESPV